MLYDHRGLAIERRKQYGYLATPAVYEPVDPRPCVELVDAIGTERVQLDEEEE